MNEPIFDLSSIFANRPTEERLFRSQIKQSYAATELALIQRYIGGESELLGAFSDDNLAIIKCILKIK